LLSEVIEPMQLLSRKPEVVDLSSPEWSEALRRVLSIPQEEREILKTKPWDLVLDVWTYFKGYCRRTLHVKQA